MKFKNIISLVLIVALLTSFLASCNENVVDGDDDETDAQTESSSELITDATEPEETEPEETEPQTEAHPETEPIESDSEESSSVETPEEAPEESAPSDETDKAPEESESLADPETTPAPDETGELEAPEETEPEESGSLGDPIKPTETPKDKPANPKKSLYMKSRETYSDGNLGSKSITVLAKYNDGVDFNIYSYKDANEKAYYLFLPCRADISAVTFNVTHRDGTISGPYTADFSDDVVTENEYVKGTTSDYSIIVMRSDVPSIMIQIDNKYGTMDDVHSDKKHETHAYGALIATVTDELAEEKGWATRYVSVDEDADSAGSMKIRGRGNATWGYDKKPYQLTLENSVDLLGMGRAKKYILLANARDATGGIRTQLAFDMGLLSGVDYTSEHRIVNLFIDGEYMGVYLLAEKAEVGENRVAIDRQKDIFFEKDNYATDDPIYGFQTDNVNANKRGFRIISPADESTIENSKRILIAAENALYGVNDYFFEMYFDLESWAKMYLLQLYTMNSDSYYGSLYFYYDYTDGKLHACTPWDFDYSLGVSWGKTDFYVDPMQYDVGNIEWIKQMLKHTNFIKAVLEVYYEGGVRDVILGMPELASEHGVINKDAVLMDTAINKQNYFPDYVEDYDDAVEYLVSICEGRITFMDNKMEAFASMVGYKIK